MPRYPGTRARILEIIQRDPGVTVSEIARLLDISEAAGRYHLRRLERSVPSQWKQKKRFPVSTDAGSPVPPLTGPGPAAGGAPSLASARAGKPNASKWRVRARAGRKVLRTYELVGRVLTGALGSDPEVCQVSRECGFAILMDATVGSDDEEEITVCSTAAARLVGEPYRSMVSATLAAEGAAAVAGVLNRLWMEPSSPNQEKKS